MRPTQLSPALWIVKLGDTLPRLRPTHGDVEHCIAQALHAGQACPPIRVVNRHEGQPLPELGHCRAIVVTGSQAPGGAVALAHNTFEARHACRVGRCAWGVPLHPEFGPDASTACAHHLADALRAQGSNPTQLRQAVKPRPHAASLLARFANLVADRERTPQPKPVSA